MDKDSEKRAVDGPQEKLGARIEEVKLDEATALRMLFVRERVTAAEAVLSLRRTEADVVISNVLKQHAEDGTYEIRDIDLEKGVLRRSKKEA
jgi:hypothetical protein